MKRTYHFIILVTTIIIVNGCASIGHMARLSEEADQAFEAGDYEKALTYYQDFIDAQRGQERSVGGRYYQRAGISAFETGNTGQAIEYMEAARHTDAADANTFFVLAKSYRETDNLSREITNLERYVNMYPDGEAFDDMQKRLFETLVESLNWQLAYDLWPQLSGNPYEDEDLLALYVLVNRALDKDDKAADMAEKVLELNIYNKIALDFLGRHHFHEAVNRYNREMRAYEANRTHRQYAQLLEALEIINTDLRIALDYFIHLYQQDPKPEYAGFLANIYERFQDEERANYYRRRAE